MKLDNMQALSELKEGNVILAPTDTVWGLSCDATNDAAVKKILEIKQRPASKSFIVLVHSLDMMGLYIHSFPNLATDLIEFSETPLTLIFPRGEKLSREVINIDGSVAVRLVKPVNEEAKFCHELIRKFNKPIVSTSANISGEVSPMNFMEIKDEIKAGVDYIVPYFHNNLSKRKPSKIIKLNEDGTFKLIR
jgi:L-threonylcarbamoyladenylate synthase